MSISLYSQTMSGLSARSVRQKTMAAVAISIAALVGATAQAQTTSSSGSLMSSLTSGPSYIALNAGASDLTRPITAFGAYGGAQQGQVYSIAMGNYFEGTNYGLEAGYVDFGSVSHYGGTSKVDAITLSMIGRIPLSSTFNLLGKVGTTYSRTDVSTNVANSNLAGAERGFDWSYGVGGEFMVTPQWAATLQYAEHFVKYPQTGNERVSSTTLGVRYYY